MTLARPISSTSVMARRQAKAAVLTLTSLREDITYGPGPYKVDREQGIIFEVKILGWDSKNGRRYLREDIERKLHLYEGKPCNIDHPKRPEDSRASEDRFGRFVNPRLKEDGVYADLHYLKSHPMAERLCEAAERMPDIFGFSHNADGECERQGDLLLVTSLNEVRSIDLVSDPATTGGLFEQRHPMKKIKLKAFLEALKAKAKGKGKEIVKALMEDDYGIADTAMMEQPPEEEGDYKEHLVSAIGTLVASDDPASHELAKKVLAMLKPESADGEIGDEEETPISEEEDETDDDEDKKAEESHKRKANPAMTQLQEQLAAQGKELAAIKAEKIRLDLLEFIRAECGKRDLPADKELLEGMQAIGDRKKITAQLDYHKKTRAPTKKQTPWSQTTDSRLTESADKSHEQWIKEIFH